MAINLSVQYNGGLLPDIIGRRFMAAWRKEEVDAARHRQEKRDNETGKKVVIAHRSVIFCEATPIGLADESKESMYGRETDRDLRNA